MKKLSYLFVLVFLTTLGFSQISKSGASPLNTSATPNQAAAAGPCVGCDGYLDPPNVIAFDYDAAGNQIKRRYIYVTNGIYRNSNPNKASQPNKEKLIESDISSEILYYPNPVQSELFIKWTNSESNKVEFLELYNMTGQLLRKYNNLKSDENTILNFEDFPSGYYILNLNYTDGSIKDLRIIKK